jgi:hypothetical protein
MTTVLDSRLAQAAVVILRVRRATAAIGKRSAEESMSQRGGGWQS